MVRGERHGKIFARDMYRPRRNLPSSPAVDRRTGTRSRHVDKNPIAAAIKLKLSG
jgi:hypothetical protein